jgi:hypothetical protein
MGAMMPYIKYTTIKLGPTGACLDMLCLGTCIEASCTYNHPLTQIAIDPSRAAAATGAKIKTSYVAYVLAHGG